MKSFQPYLLLVILFTGLIAGCRTESGEIVTKDPVVEYRKSPIVISSVNHEGTYIKVVYGQPYKRGREIFGGLEPYGEVWRTGANEATEITLTKDINMAGNPIEAGTYALFTIPEPEDWTIILNTKLGQWGAFTYDSQYDYVRFKVPAENAEEIIEALTISFDEVEENETSLSIVWDTTRVEIPIEFL
ncbi:MAG: DUF2911 domain-containing protein [Balneolaceae bacterium]